MQLLARVVGAAGGGHGAAELVATSDQQARALTDRLSRLRALSHQLENIGARVHHEKEASP